MLTFKDASVFYKSFYCIGHLPPTLIIIACMMMPKSKKQSKEKDTKASANSVTDSSPNKPEDCKVDAKQQQLLETKKTK